MNQYIDKDALLAEIERIKKEECPIDTYEGRIKLFYFERFLSFLDTLEVKEIEEPIKDLEEEIDKELNEEWYGEYINLEKFKRTAKHFFELGLKAQKGE